MNCSHPAAANNRLPTMWAYHTAEVPVTALKRWRSGMRQNTLKPRTCWHAKSFGHFQFDAYLTCLARSWWFGLKGSIKIATDLEVQCIARDIFLPNVCRHHGELACGFNVVQLFSSHSVCLIIYLVFLVYLCNTHKHTHTYYIYNIHIHIYICIDMLIYIYRMHEISADQDFHLLAMIFTCFTGAAPLG